MFVVVLFRNRIGMGGTVNGAGGRIPKRQACLAVESLGAAAAATGVVAAAADSHRQQGPCLLSIDTTTPRCHRLPVRYHYGCAPGFRVRPSLTTFAGSWESLAVGWKREACPSDHLSITLG